jgi:alkylation response protein AidB-like acyl-CoA dehydrogenase
MSHYKSNARDLEFNLFEVFGDLWGDGLYPDLDHDTVRGILAEVDRLAREDLAASYAVGDRQPPVFDPGTKTAPLPEAFRDSYDAWMASGFWHLGLCKELGGQPCPAMLLWSVGELVLGANAPIWMYGSGPGFANILFQIGTEEQKEWAKLFVRKQWGSTMDLTEPDAGSDVGAARTRAIPQPDGSWHIEGVKRFITSGEHDLAENIVHYVLARPVGVPGVGGPGTKGLSLFIVPKRHFNPATGDLGDYNGVFATNVEHKMGLKVSNTCELTFGEHGVPAKGWLVGDVHDGIRQMFLVIELARLMVATKATGTLSTGYLNALEYAKTRVQGADLLRARDKTAARVTIDHHPDVRRSLLMQKAYAEGLRALVMYAAHWLDRARSAEAAGDHLAARYAHKLADLLLPIVKGLCSERAYEQLSHESLQTFGGSGFLQDYPLEQYVRDSKIDSLYEGTTAIQSLDLVLRKLVKAPKTREVLVAEVQEFIARTSDSSELKEVREALVEALAAMDDIFSTVVNWLAASQFGEPRELYKVGLVSRRILFAAGDLLVGWLLARQAEVAQVALQRGGLTEADRAFYEGKVLVARFFAAEVLPRIGSDAKVIHRTTLDAMDAPIEVF